MRRSLLLAVAAVVLLSLVVQACGPAASPTATQASPAATPTPQATTAAATPSASSPTPPPTAKPTGAPSPTPAASGPRGELRVALNEFATEHWDPADFPIGVLSHVLAYPVYDSLVGMSTDATLAPGLAERWEMAPDGLTWTFYIRKGVKFHNGEPLTAQDVKFSLERELSTKATVASAGTLRQDIASIELPDDYTVRVRMKQPDPYLALLLSPLQTSLGYVASKKYFDEKGPETFKRNPVGSGPYKFVRHVLGDRIQIEAVGQHWRKVPAVKDYTFFNVPDPSTQVAMLISGAADIIEIGADRVPEIERRGLKSTRIPAVQQAGVPIFGTWMEGACPTSDVRVRQALSLAVNRDEIMKYIIGGAATPTMPVWQIYPFSMDLRAEEWQTPAYDPEKAKQLLREAGYPQGFNMVLNTFPLSGAPWLGKMAEAVADYWGKIGVRTELRRMEYSALRPRVLPETKPEMAGQAATWRSPTKYALPSSLQTWYHSKGQLKVFSTPELDKLIDGSGAELDARRREEMVRQALKIVRDSYTVISIAYGDAVYGWSKQVAGWQVVKGLTFIGPALETVTLR